jgi:hypothetical protein
MAIVDERGRLFGRWNLLDLALLVLILGLIPLGYAGYLLFREQPPRLVSVSPSQMAEAPEFTLTIKGENLRPYMRVSAGALQARDFFFKSTEEVEAPFPYMAPGTYDIVLYDQAQERFRLPNALTISPSGLPTTEIVAIGSFGNLDAAAVQKLTAGTELRDAGRIESVGRAIPDLTQVVSGSKIVGVAVKGALRLPAVVRFTCAVTAQQGSPSCAVANGLAAQTALLTIEAPFGKTLFQVDRVRSTAPVEAVPIEVRLAGPPSALSMIKAGDLDLGGTTNELALLARVASAEPVRASGPGAAEVTVSLIAQMQNVEQQWLYDSAPLRVGAPITLRTSRYQATGVVTKMPQPDSSASK